MDYNRLSHTTGQSAIAIASNFMGRKRKFIGENFWAHGNFVSTFGSGEEVVRNYIKNQKKENDRLEQLNIKWNPDPK